MSQQLERYILGEKIGEGAMGEVYQAYDTQTERSVAIKMLSARSLHGPRRERFKREARTIAHLEHPFVVPLYDFSLPEGDAPPFLVMRYMTGGSLADKIRQGGLPVDEVVQITRRIGQALDAAHRRGLVHRDIKPGNILLDEDGYSYLADFGIVKDSAAEESLTHDGQPGTAAYMSPEQIRGETLDRRSDIYALGVVVFEMLTGSLPFAGNLNLIFQGHLHQPVPSVLDFVNHLPDEVDEVLRQALAKKSEDRYRRAEHLAHLLEAALESPSAYMTSRNVLDQALAEAPAPLVGPGDEVASAAAITDTAPSRPVTETKETRPDRRWQLVAGGLGVVLLAVLLLFGNNLFGQTNRVEPTAAAAETGPAVAGERGATAEVNLVAEEMEQTPDEPEFIVVLQQADSAIWQQGDQLQRIPENGRVPFQAPLLFQSGGEPVRLLLPNLVSVIMDTNTSLWIENVPAGASETVLRLGQGRLLIESQHSPVRIFQEAGLQAELVAGSIGVNFDEAKGQWEVDCLAGTCRLGQVEPADQVSLAEGQYSALAPGAVVTTPSPARYSTYTNLASTIPQPSSTPTATPTPTASATPTPTQTPSPKPLPGFRGPETIVLGQSGSGKDIAVVRLGNGPQTLLMVGGIHSGYAPNSVQLAQELAVYFSQNLTAVPTNLTLYIIDNLNPDAVLAPGELLGRLNASGVDLNRNWDCRWVPDPRIFGQTRQGAGGTAVLSEPEAALLSDFISQTQPDAVLFWGAGRRTNGVVSPGACEERSLVSAELVQYYAGETGYEFVDNTEVLADPLLTGDVTNWLDKIGIPAIYVILPGFLEVDFERELDGVLSVLTAVAVPARLRQTPTPASCELPVNPAWATIFAAHRLQLGCPSGGVNQPQVVWQPFENGRMLWRQDTDRVYVLYDDLSLTSFLVNDPALSDFRESELVKGAIGYVWRSNTAVAGKLGQPEDKEMEAADVTIQDFANGFIISWRETNLQTNLLFLGANQWQTP